jgi:transposase-like protein
MEQTSRVPKTLVEAVRYFADDDICLSFLVQLRWPDGVVKCPHCGSTTVAFLANQRRWKCYGNHPRRQFSIKVGTIFEDSPLGLDKWLAATWLIANAKNGISSYEIARGLGITQKSAWFVLHRIRLAMQDGSLEKLRGQVEADETYIGGKLRNMHKRRRARMKADERGLSSKTVVMGLLERGGRVRGFVVPDNTRHSVHPVVRENVEPGAELMTDAAQVYRPLGATFVHGFVDHVEAYVKGHVHTNGLEGFWNLLKRMMRGTYVSAEPFHLHRYVDEEAFRYNERKDNDGGRFVKALGGVTGRRLTYKGLIGQPA